MSGCSFRGLQFGEGDFRFVVQAQQLCVYFTAEITEVIGVPFAEVAQDFGLLLNRCPALQPWPGVIQAFALAQGGAGRKS